MKIISKVIVIIGILLFCEQVFAQPLAVHYSKATTTEMQTGTEARPRIVSPALVSAAITALSPGATAPIQSDCSTITAGICVDSDDGIVYYYDGDSVEILGTISFQPLEATLTDIADGTITENLVNTANPWAVNEGGSGAATFTDGGILLGSGTGAFTVLGVATNGQIPIGDGTTDPVLATLTGTANEITITNGAGTITLSIPDSPVFVTPVLGAATGTSLDLGGTSLFASRQVTIDTGGGFDFNMGTASGDDFTIDTSAFIVEGDTGNVGVGTTTLKTGVHVAGADHAIGVGYADYGNVFIATTDANAIDKGGSLAFGALGGADTYPYAKIHGKKEAAAADNLAGYLAFETGNNTTSPYSAEHMRITSAGDIGHRTTSPQGDYQRSPEDTHGGYIEEIYAATSGTLTGATDRIELDIPSGWRILQCQLHVKTAVVDDAGDDTWSSELNDGAQEEAISAGSAAAQNTNVNHWGVAETWGTLTDAETDIVLTPNGGNFTAGEIEAHCLCRGFDTWDNE